MSPGCCWHTVAHQHITPARLFTNGTSDNGDGTGTDLWSVCCQGDFTACADTSELWLRPYPLKANGELPSPKLARILITVYEGIRSWLHLTSC